MIKSPIKKVLSKGTITITLLITFFYPASLNYQFSATSNHINHKAISSAEKKLKPNNNFIQELLVIRVYFNDRDQVVDIAARVTIREDGNEPEEYIIVGPVEANPREGRISNESPLGRALLNHRAGDTVEVDAPGGSFTVNIVKVE